MRSRPKLAHFHCRTCHFWRGCSRPLPRRSRNRCLHGGHGKTTAASRAPRGYVWDQCMHWTRAWRCPDRPCILEMVFLDVSLSFNSACPSPNQIAPCRNVPIGSFTLLSILVFLKLNIAKEGPRRLPLKEKLQYMDALGTILFVGGICCLLLALQWGGQTKPWRSSQIIGLFVGSGLLLIGFAYVQWRRGEAAIIPLRVLRQRSILMGACFLFFLGMASIVASNFASSWSLDRC